MCGIVGYVGQGKSQELIYRGLSRLEYRGYDSAGIAALEEKSGSFSTRVIKAAGKLKELKKIWTEIDFPSSCAMGHTRWATHGEANQVNAHPHRSGSITIVHNGIIENHQSLREKLKQEGMKISSETDSEIFGHLVAQERAKGSDLLTSVRKSFQKIEGASAFVVMDETLPGTLVVVRKGSPLVIGLGKGENFVASDVPAVIESTREIYYLQDDELAVVTKDEVKVFSLTGEAVKVKPVKIEWDVDAIDKQGYPHYMLKEIFEQPRAISDTLSAWLDLAHGKFRLDAVSVPTASKFSKEKIAEEVMNSFDKATMVHVVACGTAAHAGQFGFQILERLAKVPVKAELASEFRYRNPVLRPSDLGIVVSQSGETADTLFAVKQMKQAGMKVFAICNVRDSSIPRECDAVFYTNAGIEIGVASTKAFTTQMSIFAVIAGAIASRRGLLPEEIEGQMVRALGELPEIARKTLATSEEVKSVVHKLKDKKGFLFLGRGSFFPIALEGALKLKEIAYVHAEGYPSGELKHGPIAMVEPEMVVLAISPEKDGLLHSKSLSNFEEVRARKGTLLGLGTQDDESFRKICGHYLTVPSAAWPEIMAILAVIPLQLFSYYMALEKGTEVDQPRNLAKSVTVE